MKLTSGTLSWADTAHAVRRTKGTELRSCRIKSFLANLAIIAIITCLTVLNTDVANVWNINKITRFTRCSIYSTVA